MMEAVSYLKTLKNNKGDVKWSTFQGTAKIGYLEAFLKREIQYMRNNVSRKTKLASAGGQRKATDGHFIKEEQD
jgi:hypothetical protein